MAAGVDTRICDCCGAAYTRPHGISQNEWAKRKCCSKQCASRSRIKGNRPPLIVNPSPVKVCPVCGVTFLRKKRYSYSTWLTITYCSRSCANSVHGWTRDPNQPPATLERCECGHEATVPVRVVTLSADGAEIAGWLCLCEDCKQLFDEEESARQVWGAVKPPPQKRHKPRKEWRT